MKKATRMAATAMLVWLSLLLPGESARAERLSISQELRSEWHALVEEEPRIFLLRINGTKTPTIVMAAGVPPDPLAVVFTIRQARVDEGRVVYIEGVEPKPNGLVVKVRGRLRGKPGAGSIKAEVEVWGTKQYGPTVFATTFRSRGNASYFDTLAALIAKSKETK